MALGKPVETAIEVLAPKWAAEPEVRRELVELYDRARLARVPSPRGWNSAEPSDAVRDANLVEPGRSRT
jgi:hypothetical protein